MKLAIATHLDDSDTRVFSKHARTGEWCIAGGFEFSNWAEGDLVGKARQAFSNGWFGIETGGRVTFVAVTTVTTAEVQRLTDQLAQHFVTYYGAPDVEAARPVAAEEITQMAELCEEHTDGTLLTLSRDLTETGVRESYRAIESHKADLDQFAVHGSLDD
ncbi:DUF6505 family protein [Cognatishimia activa]|uniref:Uncharacterized protein n=1 Tax=Cognatishimia activa TaxID=1715691 RepID=A0A0P1ITV6_9RHOB|nr:DUF6505 family protein [Cognatishimia activa]MEE2945506.1 DUF6505 family protein [Pseudomonadota bacterium]CUJ36992.1 hypothetical protein TA5113_03202 [Cognatishimia activa]CUK26982.1 hypothetical protein TA5114_02801 [Cognatishimia activa]